MNEKTFNLKDYNNRILRPNILKGLKDGKYDCVLGDIDCLKIIANDPEMVAIALERMKEINKGK